MISGRIFFYLTLLLSSISVNISDAQDIEDPEEYKYVVNLEFVLNEAKLPSMVAYIVNRSAEENIAVSDIVQLTRLQEYTLQDAQHLLDFFNNTNPDFVAGLEQVLTAINVDYQRFQNSVKDKLGVDVRTFINAIGAFEVDIFDYLQAQAFRTNIYKVLKTGVYDADHLAKALEVLSRTKEQVYDAAKSSILEEVLKMSPDQFVEVLHGNGFDKRTSKVLWQALNLTAEDVYRVERFKALFQELAESVNENTTIGIVNGQHSLIVLDDVYYRDILPKVEGDAMLLRANSLHVAPREKIKRGSKIVEMYYNPENLVVAKVDIADDYSNISTNACTYITLPDRNSRQVESVDIAGRSFAKSEETVFMIGSPVVCDGTVYGLAAEELSDKIFLELFSFQAGENSAAARSPPPHHVCSLLLLVFGWWLFAGA